MRVQKGSGADESTPRVEVDLGSSAPMPWCFIHLSFGLSGCSVISGDFVFDPEQPEARIDHHYANGAGRQRSFRAVVSP